MHHHNHIFDDSALLKACYKEDIAAITQSTIKRHGALEWRCALLASELHGHVGIYSLLGVKMGLHARELLNAEAGELYVVSYAGSTPPVSCFNDGLQVSTEATIGHGLIEVLHPFAPHAEAEFSTHSSHLRLRLKSERRAFIEQEIRSAIAHYGKEAAYWDYVRELAISCWAEWSRGEIFEVIS